MTDKVIGIFNNTPHMSGNAKCQNCNHEWIAVAIIGAYNMLCPNCKFKQGKWIAAPRPSECYECNCGCDTFYKTRTGLFCSYCAKEHSS